jgi:hypothetical protein
MQPPYNNKREYTIRGEAVFTSATTGEAAVDKELGQAVELPFRA